MKKSYSTPIMETIDGYHSEDILTASSFGYEKQDNEIEVGFDDFFE